MGAAVGVGSTAVGLALPSSLLPILEAALCHQCCGARAGVDSLRKWDHDRDQEEFKERILRPAVTQTQSGLEYSLTGSYKSCCQDCRSILLATKKMLNRKDSKGPQCRGDGSGGEDPA